MGERRQTHAEAMPSSTALETAYRDVHNLLAYYEGLGVLKQALDTYRQAQAGYEHLQREQADLTQGLERLRQETEAARATLATVEGEVATKRAAAEAQMQTALAEIEAEVNGWEERLREAHDAFAQVKTDQRQAEQVAKQRVYAASQAERQRLEGETHEARATLAALREEIAEATTRRDALRGELAGLAQRILG